MSAVEPVRLYADDDQRIPLTLKRRLQEVRESLAEGVVSGVGINDFAEYKSRIGRIAGLDDAIRACAEIEADLNG